MTMYALKPIISMPGGDIIYKPKSMYEMKNIHGVKEVSHESTKIVSDIAEQVIKFLKTPLPEFAELEIRQEKILTQLSELKEQVSSLCEILKSSSQSKTVCNILARSTSNDNKERIRIDLVINADPSKPPFSILALQKIWRDTNVKVSTHLHSSSHITPLEFPLALPMSSSQNHSVDLSLIWKKVADLEVVISGVHGTPLLGEVNFLRYLSRLINPQSYDTRGGEIESLKIDTILDLCHKLSYLSSPKEIQTIFSSLGSKLGSGEWLLGKAEPTVADIAAWSAIKRLPSNKLPGNLSSWFTRCDNAFW